MHIHLYVVHAYHRVATHCEENKMPIPSLAKVFGPTIVGHSSSNPDPATIWKETNLQPKVSCAIYRNL